jgi:hypothetical protein
MTGQLSPGVGGQTGEDVSSGVDRQTGEDRISDRLRRCGLT